MFQAPLFQSIASLLALFVGNKNFPHSWVIRLFIRSFKALLCTLKSAVCLGFAFECGRRSRPNFTPFVCVDSGLSRPCPGTPALLSMCVCFWAPPSLLLVRLSVPASDPHGVFGAVTLYKCRVSSKTCATGTVFKTVLTVLDLIFQISYMIGCRIP